MKSWKIPNSFLEWEQLWHGMNEIQFTGIHGVYLKTLAFMGTQMLILWQEMLLSGKFHDFPPLHVIYCTT
jgi:hypothetical protein